VDPRDRPADHQPPDLGGALEITHQFALSLSKGELGCRERSTGFSGRSKLEWLTLSAGDAHHLVLVWSDASRAPKPAAQQTVSYKKRGKPPPWVSGTFRRAPQKAIQNSQGHQSWGEKPAGA